MSKEASLTRSSTPPDLRVKDGSAPSAEGPAHCVATISSPTKSQTRSPAPSVDELMTDPSDLTQRHSQVALNDHDEPPTSSVGSSISARSIRVGSSSSNARVAVLMASAPRG